MTVSRYTNFSRTEWARLRDATPLTLSEALNRMSYKGFGLAPPIRPASSRGAILGLARRCPNADQPDSSNRQREIHTAARPR